MTPTQKLLLRFQHDKLDSASGSTSSDYSRRNRSKFINRLMNFRTTNAFERKLLNGVITKGDRWRKKGQIKAEGQGSDD